MSIKYTFAEFIENKKVNEVAEYMTGDDPNIEFKQEFSGGAYGSKGYNYHAIHKKLGDILFFEYDSNLDSHDMSRSSSPTQMLNLSAQKKHKGYNVLISKTSNQNSWDRSPTRSGSMRSIELTHDDRNHDNIQDKINYQSERNQLSEFIGSHLSAIAKFIKTYNPGTLNFEAMFKQLNTEMPDIVPLMQKSLKTIAMKNKLYLLNNKIMNKDALESTNRQGGHLIDPVTGDIKEPTKFTGLESQKKGQEKIDKTVQDIQGFRKDNRMLRQSSIQQTKDFMNQFNSERK